MNKKQKKILKRIIVSALAFVAGLVTENTLSLPIIHIPLYIVSFLCIGYDVLIKAVKGLVNRSLLDENFLMAVASIGSAAMLEFHESVFVMLFYQIGELFSSYAVSKSRGHIKEIMSLRPDTAVVIRNGEEITVEPAEVEIGETVIVSLGERIAIDGVVVSGDSFVDTSAVTGESVKRRVGVGSTVMGGYINEGAVIKVQTTCRYENSAVARILELVESCAEAKAKSETFITRFARYYTPIVVTAALITGLIIPIFIGDFAFWLRRALIFLVISCPCALVISVPLSYFCGLGAASKKGILIKGSAFLDTAAKCKTVVLDKTGTLTKGDFAVCEVFSLIFDEEELLKIAVAAEAHSTHPIAISICEYAGNLKGFFKAEDIYEISGKGVSATVDSKKILIGSNLLLYENGIKCQLVKAAYTAVHIAVDGIYAGYILLSDTIKPQSQKAIKELYRLGIKNTVMLTGDKNQTAEEIRCSLNIGKVIAELLPEGKVTAFKEIKKNSKEPVMYVGDGINDAPVLSLADVSVAMGNHGSDAAVEAADVVLTDDNPLKISECIKISRKTCRIVKQNIYFTLALKGITFICTAFGFSNMIIAMFADVGVSVIAVLNAMRALKVKKAD